jgi:ABC-type Zn uptake system ZnuABC Zn-binding protein ZnuA
MKKQIRIGSFFLILPLLSVCFVGCRTISGEIPPVTEKLRVVTTTTFLGDVVGIVAGDVIEMSVLLEAGQNPHVYQPTPQDLVKVSEADLIFVNGLDLEEFLDDLLDGIETTAIVFEVSEGISPLEVRGPDSEHKGDEEGDQDQKSERLPSSSEDPHVWFDPNNIMIWIDNIVAVLVKNDPDNSETYRNNAAAYKSEIIQLDHWIREQVAQIPPENRKLVTDHTSLNYLAEEYGFEQIGAVIPAQTTEAETSGQQLAELIDTIREQEVKAIFVGMDFDSTLSQRVAEETGINLIPLYFSSLSAEPPADSYLTFMRFNIIAIVDALK